MKISYANFAVGLLYGFGLGVILDHADLVNLTSFSLLLGGLVLVPLLGWLETQNHRRRMAHWEQFSRRGRLSFIALHYVLIRGLIFSAVMMFALREYSPSWPVHEIAIPVVFVAMAFIGIQEWENCEDEYRHHSPLQQKARYEDE